MGVFLNLKKGDFFLSCFYVIPWFEFQEENHIFAVLF